MPYKDLAVRREKNKEANKRWYQRNKEKHQKLTAKNRRDYRQLWMEFKATQDCTFCGFSHPAVIDFHHVIRTEPKFSVNKLAQQSSYKKALEEIKKCIPLCANCHRILHWQEQQDGKEDRRKRRKKKKKADGHP
jgi:hypothetical protein